MVLKRREVEAALTAKGFKRTESHHTFFLYYTKSGIKTPIRTKTSHGSSHKDISRELVGRMAKQCKLTNQEFNDLIACPLDRDEYERKLEELDAI